jgi:hypothetical protein
VFSDISNSLLRLSFCSALFVVVAGGSVVSWLVGLPARYLQVMAFRKLGKPRDVNVTFYLRQQEFRLAGVVVCNGFECFQTGSDPASYPHTSGD